jgi:hypothetical protein
MVNTLLEIYQPRAEAGDKGAARIVDRLLGRRGRFLGLETPQKLELFQTQQEIKLEAVDVRAELAAFLARVQERAT